MSVPLEGEALEDLKSLCQHGPFVDDEGTVADLPVNEHEVARIDGLKVEVFSNEHGEPHFRVIMGDESNSFSVEDCTPQHDGMERYFRNIKKWYKKKGNKEQLIKKWNETRPTGCQVGECKPAPNAPAEAKAETKPARKK